MLLLKKRIPVFRTLCILTLLISIGTIGFCADTAPLPTNINIVAPGPNVSADLAKLSGKWVGTLSISSASGQSWGDTTQHVLIVEKIDGVCQRALPLAVSFRTAISVKKQPPNHHSFAN